MPHKEKKLRSSDTVILRMPLEDRANRFGDMQPRHGTTVPSLLEANSYILVVPSKTAPRKKKTQDKILIIVSLLAAFMKARGGVDDVSQPTT